MQFSDFEKKMINNSADTLRAITHPIRVAMINYIAQHQPVKVHDIHTTLALDQSITSQHLKILRDANLLITKRDGKNIFYSIDQKRINYIIKHIKAFDKQTLAQRKKKK